MCRARWILLVLSAAGNGCHEDPGAAGEPEVAAEAREAEGDHDALEYAFADFLKPRIEGDEPIDPYLGPLIYHEADGPDAGHAPPIGALLPDARGELDVDVSRPVVYFDDGTVLHGGEELRQLSHVWFRRDRAGRPTAQGVRSTFDARGFPVVFEVLADGSERRVLYVAKTLEERAARRFGPPLEGRRFSIERSESTVPPTEIAGLLSQGPMPMGPFVYQAADSNDIATMHCRCSPSSVGAIRSSFEYELEPLQTIEGLWPAADGDGFGPPEAPFSRLRIPSDG